MRLVLDTNILVSIYLYADPRHTPLLKPNAAQGSQTVLIDAVCYEELAQVLRSDQFKDIRQRRSVDAETLLHQIADTCEWIASAIPPTMPALPICRDADDQKFLALAARGRADALLSYDKALLKCRGRTPFAIMRPEEFVRWRGPSTS